MGDIFSPDSLLRVSGRLQRVYCASTLVVRVQSKRARAICNWQPTGKKKWPSASQQGRRRRSSPAAAVAPSARRVALWRRLWRRQPLSAAVPALYASGWFPTMVDVRQIHRQTVWAEECAANVVVALSCGKRRCVTSTYYAHWLYFTTLFLLHRHIQYT